MIDSEMAKFENAAHPAQQLLLVAQAAQRCARPPRSRPCRGPRRSSRPPWVATTAETVTGPASAATCRSTRRPGAANGSGPARGKRRGGAGGRPCRTSRWPRPTNVLTRATKGRTAVAGSGRPRCARHDRVRETQLSGASTRTGTTGASGQAFVAQEARDGRAAGAPFQGRHPRRLRAVEQVARREDAGHRRAKGGVHPRAARAGIDGEAGQPRQLVVRDPVAGEDDGVALDGTRHARAAIRHLHGFDAPPARRSA